MNKTISLLLGVDILIAVLITQFGLMLEFGSLQSWWLGLNTGLLTGVFSAAVLIFSGHFFELYRKDCHFDQKDIALRIALSLIMAFWVLYFLHSALPQFAMEWKILILILALFGACQFLWHLWYPLLLKVPGIAQKILIYGGGPLADQIEELLRRNGHPFVLAGIMNPEGSSGDEDLALKVRNEKVRKIVVSLSERRGILPVRDVLGCRFSGIEVVDAASFYEEMTGKVSIERITPSWLIFSDGFRFTRVARFWKRTLDVALACVGIFLSLPLFPLIALAIRLDTPGPIFFRQVRVGRGERPFVLTKFRTMGRDAEQRTGAVWAQEDDPRITRVGAILRKTRLDEIPQLFNVLKGDMSFVGPRPERPEFVALLKEKVPYYAHRHAVKPGLTGWAQVKYSYGASVDDSAEKLRYDLYYLKNYSLWLDGLIILETLKVVLFGRGAR